MPITTIAIILAAIVVAFFIFRFLGGCLLRLILIALIIGAAIFLAYQLGWR
jgi:hypothetical protein